MHTLQRRDNCVVFKSGLTAENCHYAFWRSALNTLLRWPWLGDVGHLISRSDSFSAPMAHSMAPHSRAGPPAIPDRPISPFDTSERFQGVSGKVGRTRWRDVMYGRSKSGTS